MVEQARKFKEPVARNQEFERSVVYEPGPAERDNVVVGSLWMLGITLALFFLPAINGFIGGMVGGYKVGTVKRALVAAILPAIAAAAGLWLILALLEAPVWGAIAGTAVAVVIVLSDIGMFVGAAIGGVLRRRRV